MPSGEQLQPFSTQQVLHWAIGALYLSGTLMALKGPCAFQTDEDLLQNFTKTNRQESPSIPASCYGANIKMPQDNLFQEMFLLEVSSKLHVPSPYLQTERQ